jgi:DNA-binding transcriptional ArsR family regulator
MTYERAMRALADPTRRAIFERLRDGAKPVGRLADGFDVTRPAVSQHLRVLEEAGLVRVERAGTRRIYSVNMEGLEQLRRYLDQFWGDVLEAFRGEAERPSSPASRPRQPRRKSKGARKHGQR